ncbi:MAG: ATP-grasp domain-containing protein [Patescibacteria group bacterium]
MRLREFEGKALFTSYGIPVPEGSLLEAPTTLSSFPVVLKAQVRSGDRMKAGGIIFAENQAEAEEGLATLFSKEISGEPVEHILVEERVQATNEYYVSFSYDTDTRAPVLSLSRTGGTGISDAHTTPISILEGLTDKLLSMAYTAADIPKEVHSEFSDVIQKLWKLFIDEYALVAEINPLFETAGGLVAGDAKIQTDDERVAPGEKRILTLTGDIAILASGGGASLLNMDTLIRAGGKPANYTEYSGNPPASVVKELTLRVLSHPGLRGCWVVGAAANFTDIYETMSGFLEALREVKPTFPIVIRRDGPRREEAFRMLQDAAQEEGFDIHLFDATTSMKDTATTMVTLAYKTV